MSYSMFFDLSAGLKEQLHVPKGTLKSILEHIAFVEQTLGFEKYQYESNPPHWIMKPADGVTDKVLCETTEEHNRFVMGLWSRMEDWHTNPIEDGEVVTPEDAATFWHGLARIPAPPPERWTREYYVSRMEHLYEVMRGRESEGVSFGAKALNAKQARPSSGLNRKTGRQSSTQDMILIPGRFLVILFSTDRRADLTCLIKAYVRGVIFVLYNKCHSWTGN